MCLRVSVCVYVWSRFVYAIFYQIQRMILPVYDHESIADNYLKKPKKSRRIEFACDLSIALFIVQIPHVVIPRSEIFVAQNFQYADLVISHRKFVYAIQYAAVVGSICPMQKKSAKE